MALGQDSSLREAGAYGSVFKRETQSHGWVRPGLWALGGGPGVGRQMSGGSEGRGFPPASSPKGLSHRVRPSDPPPSLPPPLHRHVDLGEWD